MKTGDRIRITYEGRTVDGRNGLASPNGKSLALEFDAMLGGHAGMMPVLKDDDAGEYYSILTGCAVTVEPYEADIVEHMIKNQLEPQLRARQMREEGIDVDFVMTNVSPGATGYEITCVKCGRKGRVPFEPPADKAAVCPRCLR